ncbi:acetoin utilization protein AcuA [Salsuginibacillus halophilus]|uniref:Acetoin utilization protein AcuA n=1 Tax=Salsuginibacillus halophilus TaxID=517424 RepID=A0A2P8HED2_9BACI|nr:GNAT family N-acetyltransferase [Salsuginibacillus halophilus]PSL44555.1 acetoin utilization protein AcuA [Salsuginibacillus halophilus]
MKHKKMFFSREIPFQDRTITIEGPISGKKIHELSFNEGLVAFRRPDEQKKALIGIADLPEGRINVALDGDQVIGYVTFLYPDPLERWSEAELDNLLELGAIEIAPEYRGAKIGSHLLELSMLDDAMEDYIIITTEYYWHWDLKGSGLSIWDYRKVMEKMMNAGGLEWMATDDPEISSHPANCLMVRIGDRVDNDSIQQFDAVRFSGRFMF